MFYCIKIVCSVYRKAYVRAWWLPPPATWAVISGCTTHVALSVVTTHYTAECYLYIVLASRNLYLPQLRAQLKTSHINYQGIIKLFLDSVQYRFYFSKYQLILRSIILAMKIETFNCRFRNMQYFNLSIFLWCLCRMFSMNISILS